MGECNKLDHIDAIINEKEGLNRGQWYYISIKLKDFKGEPALAGWNVKFDEAIVFRDGRKIARENDVQTENVIIISLFGCCDSDGTTIKKCTKCADKDMNLIKKKRRNPMLTWNENDDKNNSQFLQIIACDEVVSELGEIKFRLRFSCCIGVSKQPHINHRQIVNNIEQVGIHKNCAGLRMNAVIQIGELYKRVFVINNISPIRVLGKVTNTTKKRKRDDENEMEEMDDLDDITKFDGNLNLTTRNINVDRNVDIYRFLQKKYCYDPGSILHKLTLAYHLKLGNLFPFPYQEIFSPEFFHKLNMNLLDPRSPLMLEIFTITGCGAVMYDSNLSEKYFLKAMHLIPDLLNKKLSENEYIFFADGVNRLSMFLSALGELSKARYYNDLAFKIVNKYALTVAFESGIYENILWCSTAFYLSPELLISSIEWSLSRNRYTSSCFFLFLYIVTLVTPRVVQYVIHGDSFIQICPMEKKNIPTALSLLNQLLESIKIEGFHKVTDGKRTYESLIYNGLLSLKAWILGDYDQASSLVTQTIYQINLLKAKSLPFFAYIPVYFASFVAYQLQFLEESKIDECEICLTAALKIPETRWLKFLIDYISLGYDFPNIESTGKKWNQSPHLFKAHSIINETLLLLDSKIVQ